MLTLLECSPGYTDQVTGITFIGCDTDGFQELKPIPLADGIENLPEMSSESAEGLIL